MVATMRMRVTRGESSPVLALLPCPSTELLRRFLVQGNEDSRIKPLRGFDWRDCRRRIAGKFGAWDRSTMHERPRARFVVVTRRKCKRRKKKAKERVYWSVRLVRLPVESSISIT